MPVHHYPPKKYIKIMTSKCRKTYRKADQRTQIGHWNRTLTDPPWSKWSRWKAAGCRRRRWEEGRAPHSFYHPLCRQSYWCLCRLSARAQPEPQLEDRRESQWLRGNADVLHQERRSKGQNLVFAGIFFNSTSYAKPPPRSLTCVPQDILCTRSSHKPRLNARSF